MPYVTVGIGWLVFHNVWIAVMAYHLGIIAILGFERKKVPFNLISKSRNYKILILTAAMGVTGGLILYLCWPLLNIPGDITLFLQRGGLTPALWPYFIIYFILINPTLEECFWRGYLFDRSRQITLNDILFSGYHILVLAGMINFMWLIAVFVILIIGAWVWRQANRWNQGLAASIISHIAADASIILVIYFMLILKGV
jgi:membrane protease YdiL (CAAX protease family)